MQLKEVIQAWGHKNVRATHPTTFEITREKNLSKRGDCIIAVAANKALANLTPQFKENLRKENAKITIHIQTGETTEFVNAFGSSKLILTHPKDVVVRKSDYVCGRTLAIRADKAACDLSRRLIEKLRNPKQEVIITVTVEA
jgi:hypothetical protein